MYLMMALNNKTPDFRANDAHHARIEALRSSQNVHGAFVAVMCRENHVVGICGIYEAGVEISAVQLEGAPSKRDLIQLLDTRLTLNTPPRHTKIVPPEDIGSFIPSRMTRNLSAYATA